ncbi:MAG: hypothetical protein QXD05_01110 [Candidatus Pacearchaeota archaeon]
MVKEEIVEGLKMALSKGESLEKAMMSFFNAGYLKEDIEDAARYLQAPKLNSNKIQNFYPSENQKLQTEVYNKSLPYSSGTPTEQKIIQKVSNYQEKSNKMGTVITIILVFILIVLIGVLVGLIIFKEEVSKFFSENIGLIIKTLIIKNFMT